jgi:ribonuclease P protein component
MTEAVDTLKRRRDFLRVARLRNSTATRGLVLQAGARGDDTVPGPRVGFTASRKVGNAVERNRARRRLRAAVREVIPLHAAPGHDYVVIARAATLERPYDALKNDLAVALKRLDVWRER